MSIDEKTDLDLLVDIQIKATRRAGRPIDEIPGLGKFCEDLIKGAAKRGYPLTRKGWSALAGIVCRHKDFLNQHPPRGYGTYHDWAKRKGLA